jgi:hypothetical protein
LVRNATTNTCVTPAPSSTCSQSLSDDEGDDDEDSSKIIPTLTAPQPVTIHAGETLKVAFTAVDCADRPIKVVAAAALPRGATIVNSFDSELHVAKAVVTWAIPVNTKAHSLSITLKAVVTDNGKTISSAPKSVVVKVLPSVQEQIVTDGIVVSNTLTSARFNAKTHKLEVSGQVLWAANSTVVQRQAILRAETAVVDNAINHAYLGTAVVALDGTWAASIAMNEASAPCSVDVSFQGKVAVKSVRGVSCCND